MCVVNTGLIGENWGCMSLVQSYDEIAQNLNQQFEEFNEG